jgi:endonuclease YncB( thermonuclease family)
LLGIDAPELAGHCRAGRTCAPGDPLASRAALASLLALGGVTVQSFGPDLYGRRLSIGRTRSGTNLSCAQITGGNAVFKPNWDKALRIKRECDQ